MKKKSFYFFGLSLLLVLLLVASTLVETARRKEKVLGNQTGELADESSVPTKRELLNTQKLNQKAIDYVKTMDQYLKNSAGEIDVVAYEEFADGNYSTIVTFPTKSGFSAEVRINFDGSRIKEAIFAPEGINQISEEDCLGQDGRIVLFSDQDGCLPEEMILAEGDSEKGRFYCCLLPN